MAESKKDKLNTTEQQTLKIIDQLLLGSAKKYKYFYAGDGHSTWLDNIRWYKGQQWSGNRGDDKASLVFNRIFSTIQREVPYMTDRKPKLYIDPQEPSDKVPAKIIERIIETRWTDADMEMKIPDGVTHAKLVGTGYLHPYWNAELADGLGDVDCESVDPLEIFPLPYIKSLREGEGVFWCRWVSLGWVKKHFEDGWRVKPDNTEDMLVPDRAKETNGKNAEGATRQVGDISTSSSTSERTDYLPSGTGSDIGGSEYKRILLKTLIIKDDSVFDSVDAEKDKEIKRKPFKNGRQITYAGNVILEDIEFPFENFPGIVEIKNYINPGEFFAMSDIDQIKDGQKGYNKLQSMVIDAINRDVYRQKFLLESSGIEADNFIVSSDVVYNTRVANPISETGQWGLPPQVLQYGQVYENAIEKTAGVADYSAPSSGNLPSGAALATFQEVTQVRLRQKLRNLEYAVRIVGTCWLEMILKNYTEKRIMRVFNSNTGQSEYVFVFREENPAMAEQIKQQAMQEIVPGTEEIDPKTQQPVPGSGTPKYQHVLNMAEIKGTLDLRVDTNSTISTSRVANFETSVLLFDRGVIDDQALLEAADYKNLHEILKRNAMKKQQAQQAQQQALQQQQQLEGAKVQIQAQKNMVDVQTNTEDNQTKLEIEAMRQSNQKEFYEKEEKLKRLDKKIGGK